MFGLGIVLPSLLLGYLAFRGIQNDRALLEKERLERTRQAAERVLKAVDDGIKVIESSLAKISADRSGEPSPETKTVLERLAASGSLVEQVFCLEDLGTIHFPIAEALYVADGRREAGSSPVADPGDSIEVQSAERLEFQQKDYPGAIASYRQMLGRSTDPRFSAAILNAVARVQRKSGRLREAVSTYETIVRDYAGTVVSGGMPPGPSACLEIAVLFRELGDETRSIQRAVDLYRSLVRRTWELEKAEFEFFAGRARGLIEDVLAGETPGLDLAPVRREFESLSSEEGRSRRRTERLLVFEEGAAAPLEAKITAAPGPDAAGPLVIRLALDVGRLPYLVSIQRPADGPGRGSPRAWGVVIDAERLRDNILRPALSENFPSAETAWVFRDRDGAVLLSSEKAAEGPVTFRTNFDSNVPAGTLEFHQLSSGPISTFLLSRRGLYSFVFLLIAGILVFGLVLTIRSVSRELELARMKSDFVSTVSHEFKSPLTSIRQLAEMLQSGRVPSEERRQKYYDVLLEQSERLGLLADNILNLAKIESGRAEFRFETTDVGALLDEVISSIQERVRHEGFAIGLEVEKDLPSLGADRAALAQAVINLVDNAIKYSGESRSVSVRAALEGPALVIGVRDSGVGIRKEDLDRVFERFFRAGNELTRTVKGSGLGLTLVKEIVEAHRGRVLVESEPGKGSLFSIRLPLPQTKGDLP